MIFFDMTTFVCNCKTAEGAMELAKYLESRFPEIRYQNAKALRFNVVLTTDGKAAVYCEQPFNEIGKADIKAAVMDFVAIKQGKSQNPSARSSVPFPRTSRGSASGYARA